MRTTGIVVAIVCLFIVCIPAVTALDQGNSGDGVSNTVSFLIYKVTAKPLSQMNAKDFEEAGDQENHNPIPNYGYQAVYYHAASVHLDREYVATHKAYDSHFYSQQELLLRKRSEALSAQIEKSPADEYSKEEKKKVDNLQKLAQSKYNEAYAAEHSGKQSVTSGHLCLIVTATFGSPLASEVQLVREYRDGTVRQSYTGSQFFTGFNAWYYSFSPAVASYIATHPLVKSVMRVCLVPLLEIVFLSQNLHAVLGFNPEIATVCVLVFAAAFFSLVYIFPPAFLTVWLAGRKGWKVPAPGSMRPVLWVWTLLLFGLAAGILLTFDFLTIITSGLLVACTIILIAGTASLTLARYLADWSCIRQG